MPLLTGLTAQINSIKTRTRFTLLRSWLIGMALYSNMERPLLGARAKNIAAILTKQYAILFAVALILGAPISYVLIKLLMEFAYAYHMPITYSGVAMAVAILILVLLATVSTQIRKVVLSNPVIGLNAE